MFAVLIILMSSIKGQRHEQDEAVQQHPCLPFCFLDQIFPLHIQQAISEILRFALPCGTCLIPIKKTEHALKRSQIQNLT